MFSIFIKQEPKLVRKEHIVNHLAAIRRSNQLKHGIQLSNAGTQAKKMKDEIIVIDSDSDESNVKQLEDRTISSSDDSDVDLRVLKGEFTI